MQDLEKWFTVVTQHIAAIDPNAFDSVDLQIARRDMRNAAALVSQKEPRKLTPAEARNQSGPNQGDHGSGTINN